MSSIQDIENEIVEEFSFFDDWTDKYQFIVEGGKDLSPLPEECRNDTFLIKGCQSKVWLSPEWKEDKLFFNADSDSAIVKGLIALLVRVLSGQKPSDIAQAKLEFLDRIGMISHLSPNRSNGLLQMIKQIKNYASEYAKQN